MSEQPQSISILDARLAEIDRRLGVIQTGLVSDEADPAAAPREPPAAPAPDPGLPRRVLVPPPAAPAAPAAPAVRAAPDALARSGAAALTAQLRELADAHARLLDSMRELISAYELAIAPPATVRELSLSAGPLKSTGALREFEHALSRIPEVRSVEVRGYEGGDRAIVDVHLLDATS